MNEQNI